MKSRLFSALAALLAGGGLASAQYPSYPGNLANMQPVPAYAAYPYPQPQQWMPQAQYMTPYTGAPIPVSGQRPRLISGWPPRADAMPPAPGTPITMDVMPASAQLPPQHKRGKILRPAHSGVVRASDAEVVVEPLHSLPAHLPQQLPPADGVYGSCDDGDCGDMVCEPACAVQIPEHPLDREPCGHHAYARADYLYLWVNNQDSPALFRFTLPQGAFDLDADDLDNGERNGARTTIGWWLPECKKLALEASFLWLAPRHPAFRTDSPNIVRPFFNAATGTEGIPIGVTQPGFSTGFAEARSAMRLYGAESGLRREIFRHSGCHLDITGGFRYLELDEELSVQTRSNSLLVGTSVITSDRFDTNNLYFGGQIGLEGEVNLGSRITLNPWGKAGVGHNRQRVRIAGDTVTIAADGTVTQVNSGFLALPSNSGNFQAEEVTFMPEFGLNVGVRITQNIRFNVGYTMLYINSVARPGDHVSRNLNRGQVPTPADPFVSPRFVDVNDTDFWAQGGNAGLEIRW